MQIFCNWKFFNNFLRISFVLLFIWFSFLFSQTILSTLQYTANIELHIIWYLFGDEEQSDGEYLFCIVYVLMMAVYGLVFKLLLK